MWRGRSEFDRQRKRFSNVAEIELVASEREKIVEKMTLRERAVVVAITLGVPASLIAFTFSLSVLQILQRIKVKCDG